MEFAMNQLTGKQIKVSDNIYEKIMGENPVRFVTNPLTGRKIKIGSKTYKKVMAKKEVMDKKEVCTLPIPEGNFIGNDDIDTYLLSFLDHQPLVMFSQVIKKLSYLCKKETALVNRVEQYKFNKVICIKRLIGCAITAERCMYHGSTRQYIKKYLETNYKIEPDDLRVNNTIRILLADGNLIPNKKYKGHFRVSDTFKKWLGGGYHEYMKKYNICDDDIWNYKEVVKTEAVEESSYESSEFYDDSNDADYIP